MLPPILVAGAVAGAAPAAAGTFPPGFHFLPGRISPHNENPSLDALGKKISFLIKFLLQKQYFEPDSGSGIPGR